MARTWILDTETKGTGARVVPLDTVSQRRSSTERVLTGGQPARRREPEPPTPRAPRRFKIVDLLTRQTIAEDVDVRGAVAALADIRSTVDVTVYLWQEASDRWRPLTLGEQSAMWGLAHPQ